MKTTNLFLILLLVSVAATWYIRINNEKEFNKKEKINIPLSIAINEMNDFKPNKSYYKERYIIGVKKRTYVPFIYKYDTLSTSPFMYYSNDIE
jgi:hypothetical protein